MIDFSFSSFVFLFFFFSSIIHCQFFQWLYFIIFFRLKETFRIIIIMISKNVNEEDVCLEFIFGRHLQWWWWWFNFDLARKQEKDDIIIIIIWSIIHHHHHQIQCNIVNLIFSSFFVYIFWLIYQFFCLFVSLDLKTKETMNSINQYSINENKT